jgi:predicted protein tyrosine phosphatase
MEKDMTTIYVAHDDFGQILSVVGEDGDVPVARQGINVARFDIAGEMERLEVHELARRFHVDVRENRLVEGPVEDPREA